MVRAYRTLKQRMDSWTARRIVGPETLEGGKNIIAGFGGECHLFRKVYLGGEFPGVNSYQGVSNFGQYARKVISEGFPSLVADQIHKVGVVNLEDELFDSEIQKAQRNYAMGGGASISGLLFGVAGVVLSDDLLLTSGVLIGGAVVGGIAASISQRQKVRSQVMLAAWVTDDYVKSLRNTFGDVKF
jgi:hypothetical protein